MAQHTNAHIDADRRGSRRRTEPPLGTAHPTGPFPGPYEGMEPRGDAWHEHAATRIDAGVSIPHGLAIPKRAIANAARDAQATDVPER